jgi:hypothetical protein
MPALLRIGLGYHGFCFGDVKVGSNQPSSWSNALDKPMHGLR